MWSASQAANANHDDNSANDSHSSNLTLLSHFSQSERKSELVCKRKNVRLRKNELVKYEKVAVYGHLHQFQEEKRAGVLLPTSPYQKITPKIS